MKVPRIAALALLLVVVGCAQRVDVLPGYTRASASEHASLLRAISDYYTLRARAFVLGDESVLLAAYPKLAEGANLKEGINLDAFRIPLWREAEATEVTHQVDSYEPTRIYVSGIRAVAFVHGSETMQIRGGPSGTKAASSTASRPAGSREPSF